PDAFDLVRFWVVRDGDAPVAAAVRTEPFNLVLGDPTSEAALGPLLSAGPRRREPFTRVLGDPTSEAALGPLLEAVLGDDPEVPGIVGNVPFVESAAERLPGGRCRGRE